jgi:hydroxymethylbilane synthase
VKLRLATRGSALARWQAEHVAAALAAADPALEVELLIVETTGDRVRDVPLWEIGGRGVFVKEVQAAVLDGRADLAVHSAKDLPSRDTPGLAIAAVPERGDPRDGLVGRPLEELPTGALVATGSVRRRAQLADLRPDLRFTGLRGNLDTRLAAASRYDAIVVAVAGLVRLERMAALTEALDPSVMVPQVGQGALAVECRDDDDATRAALSVLDHAPTRAAVTAERTFLARLGTGCELPIGAAAVAGPDGGLVLDAVICTLDGRIVLRHRAAGDDPAALGGAVADHLLDGAGASALLADLGLAEPVGA